MEFTIKAGELNKVLRPLKGVLNAKSIIPIRDEEFLFDASRPMLVRETTEDGTYEVILMPVRVS